MEREKNMETPKKKHTQITICSSSKLLSNLQKLFYSLLYISKKQQKELLQRTQKHLQISLILPP